MVPLPTIDQFPSFRDMLSRVRSLKCIWYLPNQKRSCKVPLTEDSSKKALGLASTVSNSALSTQSAREDLAIIAEDCCCTLHHRNKVWGSGLAQGLARRWHNEIRIYLEHLGHNIIIPKKEAVGIVDLIPIAFARHQVLDRETLTSKLLSNIDISARKTGSLYIYTHIEEAFKGMVKIGYTAKTIQSRLDDWAKCGHGDPNLLASIVDVRHPERVEALVHLELIECWHELRWCKAHERSHIEWFKVDLTRASTVARLWREWMKRANPYDRRGYLTALWRRHINFLVEHGNPITAEAMIQIQQIEEGSDKIYDFIDDELLRKGSDNRVKKEEVEQDGSLRLSWKLLTDSTALPVKL